MKSITQILMELAGKDCPIRIDLKSKTIKAKGKVIYEDGEIKRDKIIWGDTEYDCLKSRTLINESEKKDIEELYQLFKYSLPCKQDMSRKENFYCLPVDKMTHRQLVDGLERGIARVWLECYVLFNGKEIESKFQNDKAFFWKSENDKDLVVLREWIS